jgi:hypothetical protein
MILWALLEFVPDVGPCGVLTLFMIRYWLSFWPLGITMLIVGDTSV